MMKGKSWLFAGLIFLFLILRLAVLFTQIDELYEEEELYRGTIAREIIQGPLIPIWEYLDYRVECFPGGTLVAGVLAAPFFLLFGQTYISLKLTGLMFSLGTFILWILFLNKFFNHRTAFIAGLIFIFCPPFYSKISLVTWGAHPEANLFTILSICIFCGIFFDSKVLPRDNYYTNNNQRFFLLGLVSGFGIWFVQTYFLTLGYLLLCWFAFDRRFALRKGFFIFCLGAILGCSPGIFYGLFYGGDILNINGNNIFLGFLANDINQVPGKIFSFFISGLPAAFLFKDIYFLKSRIASCLYYFVFLGAFLYLSWINRKGLWALIRAVMYPLTLKEVKVYPGALSREAVLLLFPFLFVLVYGMSSFSLDSEHWNDYIGYRYVVVLMPFIFVIIAVFLERIRKKMLISSLFLAVVLVLGTAGNLKLIAGDNFGRYFQDRGYSYGIVGDKIGLRIKDNLSEYILPFNKLRDDLRGEFYEGLGAGIAWRLRDEEAGRAKEVIETEIPSQYRADCYRGWGTLFAPEYPEDFLKALKTSKEIDLRYRQFFYEGFGRNMNFFDNMREAFKSIDRIDQGYRRFCYVGLGYAIGFRLKGFSEKRKALTDMIDEQYLEYVRQGMSQGMNAR